MLLSMLVCLASATRPRIGNILSLHRFKDEAHIALTLSGTGHDVVNAAIEKLRIARRVFSIGMYAITMIWATAGCAARGPRYSQYLGKVLAPGESTR